MRVALINITGADDPALLSKAFSEALGEEVEVQTFSKSEHGEKSVQASAMFILRRNEAEQLTGEGNYLILPESGDDREVAMARKLEKVGLTVRTASDGIDGSRMGSDLKAWFETGAYPVAEAPQSQESDEFAFLFDEEPEVAEAEAEAEPTPIPAPAPEPVVEPAPVRRSSGIPLDNDVADIPLPGVPPAPAAPEPKDEESSPEFRRFRTLPVDSMDPNEAPAPVADDYDMEPAPLPRRQEAPAPAPAPIAQEAPAPAPIPVQETPTPAPTQGTWQEDEVPALPRRRAMEDVQEAPIPVTPPVEEAPIPVSGSSLPSWEDFQDQEPAPLPVRSDPVAEEAPAPIPVQRREPEVPAYRASEPADTGYEQEPAPLPRRRAEAPVAPILDVSDPLEEQEAPRWDRRQAPARTSSSLEDEIDFGGIQKAAQTRQEARRAPEPIRREEPVARQEEYAERRPRRQSAPVATSEYHEEPARRIPAVDDYSEQEDRMPDTFRSRESIMEDEAVGQRTPRQGRPINTPAMDLQAEFGSGAGKFVPASESAFIYYVTGSRGGAGKTTLAYLLAQLLAAAAKKAGRGEEVYLVEGDYENPKLANRLGLARDQNLGELARFFEAIQQNRSLPGGSKFEVDATTRSIVDKITFQMDDTGLKVLACPYDLTTRKSTTIRLAMQKAITQVSKSAKYIVIDGDTLSNDDILDRELISKAHHVMVVAWGNSDADMGDGIRAAHTLKTPEASGGMGVPASRVSMFFNRTDYETVEKIKVQIRPHSVSGYIPELPEFNNAWIGTVEPSENFYNANACVARAANQIYPNADLIPFANREFHRSTPGATTRKRGLLGFLRNKG